MPKRKNFSANRKAQIVLEALKEGKSIAQIVRPNTRDSLMNATPRLGS